MKKMLFLVFALANTVVYAQSKKKQIITLNNRVDSFRLALSKEIKLSNENSIKLNSKVDSFRLALSNEIKLSNENSIKLNSRLDSFRLALSSERQSKLSNEERHLLKINNLKIEIKNSEAELEAERNRNNILQNEIENKKLNIDSLEDLIKQHFQRYSGLIPNYFFGCWGECGVDGPERWITINKYKTGDITIEQYECGGGVEEIFKVQGTDKFVFLFDKGCEGSFLGYSAALVSATKSSISLTTISRADFEFFLDKNYPENMIFDSEEGFVMSKSILNLFNNKGNTERYNYSKYANGYTKELK